MIPIDKEPKITIETDASLNSVKTRLTYTLALFCVRK